MNLLKTGLLNGIAVSIKMATLLIINKILAIYVGPAGYALIGQFQNAIQIIMSFASGALNTGVVKYTAEFENDTTQQRRVWGTAGVITLAASLSTASIIIFFNQKLALFFLHDTQYANIFTYFAVALVFFTFNSLLLAVLNGKQLIKQYVFTNICGSILSLLVTGLMTVYYKLEGALISLAIYQSLTFIVTFTICSKYEWFKLKYFLTGLSKAMAGNLFRFTLMALVSACCTPLAQIFIRTEITDTIGINEAGQWEALMRLSSAMLLFATTTLSIYFIPKFSKLTLIADVKEEMISALKLIIPCLILVFTSVFLLKNTIITLLFSSEFLPIAEVIHIQLIADFFKVISWLLAYYFISKSKVKIIIFLELFFGCLLVLQSTYFAKLFGLMGVPLAYVSSYILYLLFLTYFLLKERDFA